jgi:hypothetical protein
MSMMRIGRRKVSRGFTQMNADPRNIIEMRKFDSVASKGSEILHCCLRVLVFLSYLRLIRANLRTVSDHRCAASLRLAGVPFNFFRSLTADAQQVSDLPQCLLISHGL